ncbi:MAG: M20/M25/M40 family metallo-hydrolase [Streptosporangiales bacterium]|nr:M20/M25/M40 family metallo-hydrolase [Streptosporangiales bacterium]
MEEVVSICSGLVALDTTNFGDAESRGEREAAEYVAALLADARLEPQVLESADRRANVVCQVPGSDPDAAGLLVHGHLDVVPADAAGWTVPPFSGEVRDGEVWGRGAIDMKHLIASTLTVVRNWSRRGLRPRRDLVLAFVADEEDGGRYGAHWLVDEHPDLLTGVTEAIGEGGGYTVYLPDGSRVYPLGTGERGAAWTRLRAVGTAGHGSRPTRDNPVARVAAAVTRIGGYEWPVRLAPAVKALLGALEDVIGQRIDPANLDPVRPALGRAADLVEGVLRNSASPTMLEAGYKVNVIPAVATAFVDGRMLPGFEDEFTTTLRALAGDDVEVDFVRRSSPIQAPLTGGVVDAAVKTIAAEDPDGVVVPNCATGGSDAKAFGRLGIACYGFAPLWFPPSFDHRSLVHGIDERVPVSALEFGARVLDRFLRTC